MLDHSDRNRRFWLATAIAVLVAHFFAWVLMYRRLIPQGDDFLHVSIGGRPWGQFTFQDWLQQYKIDYTEINGRFADAVARLILMQGVEAWQILGAACFTGMIFLVWLWSRRGKGKQEAWMFPATLVLAGSIIIIMMIVKPAVAGDAVFWTTSAIGYFGSVLLVLASGFLFVRVCEVPILRDQTRYFLGIPLIFLTHIYHEVSSFSLAAIVLASWLFYHRKIRNRIAVSYTVASAFGFIVQIAAPGIWSRTSNFEEQNALSFWGRLKLGSDLYVEMAWPALMLIVVIMVLIAGEKHWVAALSLVSGSLLIVFSLATGGTPLGRLAENQLSPVLLILLFISGVVWFSENRRVLGAAPLLMWFGIAGALVIPLMLGIGARGHVPATFLTYAAGVIAISRSFSAMHPPIWFSGVALVLVLTMVLVPVSALQINNDMGRNEQRWNETVAQIDQARSGTRHVIEIPEEWPHPYLMYAFAFDSRYYDVIRQYYDLPSHVHFKK